MWGVALGLGPSGTARLEHPSAAQKARLHHPDMQVDDRRRADLLMPWPASPKVLTFCSLLSQRLLCYYLGIATPRKAGMQPAGLHFCSQRGLEPYTSFMTPKRERHDGRANQYCRFDKGDCLLVSSEGKLQSSWTWWGHLSIHQKSVNNLVGDLGVCNLIETDFKYKIEVSRRSRNG